MPVKLQKDLSFDDKSVLLRRARAKFLSKALAKELLRANPDSKLFKSYRGTLSCSSILQQTGKKLATVYCKNRWCAVCNRIRTAKLINGYSSELQAFKEPYFVTLTKKTVEGAYLSDSMALMGEVWRFIMLTRENRYKRKVKGIRKAECTIRPNGYYHYHFHVIIDGKDNAEWLVSEWLKRCPDSDPLAQDLRPADEGSFKELFKYFTKLTVKSGSSVALFPYSRMDVIFTAMYKKRTFQPFGGVKIFSEDIEDINAQDYTFLEDCEKVWKWYESDWIDEWGECLTGYSPSESFTKIFESKNT